MFGRVIRYAARNQCRTLSMHHYSRGFASVSMGSIKSLRHMTDCPIVDCKEALVTVMAENADLEGDEALLPLAVEYLRKKGMATANKKASRDATQGLITLLGSDNGQVMLEVNCETDFVSRNDKFQTLCTDLAEEVTANALSSDSEMSLDTVRALNITHADGEVMSVPDSFASVIGSLKENIQLRRVAGLTANDTSILGSYVHQNQHPGSDPLLTRTGKTPVYLGKQGAIVKLSWTGDSADREQLATLAEKLAMHVTASRPLFVERTQVPEEDIAKERDILLEQIKDSGKPADIVEKMVTGKLQKYFNDVCLVDQEYVVVDANDKKQTVGKLLKSSATTLKAPDLTIAAFHRYAVGEGMVVAEKKSLAEEVEAMTAQQKK